VKALLVDLDDTLLDYSGGVDACWEAACEAAAPNVERAALLAALIDTRQWFWSDPERHRRERVDMVGAWTKIAARALEELHEGHGGACVTVEEIADELAAVAFDDGHVASIVEGAIDDLRQRARVGDLGRPALEGRLVHA